MYFDIKMKASGETSGIYFYIFQHSNKTIFMSWHKMSQIYMFTS